MAASDSVHSRFVAWLKIILPLAALGLLSTLFLFARSGGDAVSQLPFADGATSQLAGRGGMGAPVYSGMTDTGDLITVQADTARTGDGSLAAQTFDADVVFTDGSRIALTAVSAEIADGFEDAWLDGAVILDSSTGWQVRTDRMRTALNRIDMESAAAVSVTGPVGHIDAGQVRVTDAGGEDGVQMIFTGGVKMVYVPGLDESDAE